MSSEEEIPYEKRIENEISHHSNLLKQQRKTSSNEVQGIAPKVKAYHYANQVYNPYLREKMPNITNMLPYILNIANKKSDQFCILSLGSGTGDWELQVMMKEPTKIKCELVDINPDLLSGCQAFASKHSLLLEAKICDINRIKLDESTYDVVLVRSSLHHFMELEHIFTEISKSLVDQGQFLVIGESIGRNALRIYPDTRKIVQKIFDMLPNKFKYNHLTKRTDSSIPADNDHPDHFEAIRSEEIMPLLFEYFKPKEYVVYDAFLSLLLDFRYGPNYDLTIQLDKCLVETITYLDMHYISSSILKPTCLFGIFSN
jgi:ubiquinone/menaquinone biosynthesis C-methylase UbiE